MPLALITGSASRLGKVIATHLADNGFDLILHINKSRAEGQRLRKAIADGGTKTALVSCDFAKSARVPAFFERIVERYGTPDLIVNNASVFEYDFPGKASIGALDRSVAVHIKAPLILLELALKKARRKHPVTVVNILDQKLLNLNPDYFSYTIGKAGLFALTQMWQMAPQDRMRVFGILPGLLFPSGQQTKSDFDRVKNNTVLKRNPSPQEIANAVLFVAQNPSIPGQNLVIDGGESLMRRKRDIAYE
jgi:NAD(P)-dependent dehydrogenase (short-subunit alcohol dehydrogenase family)